MALRASRSRCSPSPGAEIPGELVYKAPKHSKRSQQRCLLPTAPGVGWNCKLGPELLEDL